MKKLLSVLTLTSLLILGAKAQIVNVNTVDKKVAILEEYTGIYCTFCPDGHRVANEIAAANPNKFYAINIHTGSYANPRTGDPDYRTAFGSPLVNQTGITGYPSATINRRVFGGNSGTAIGRRADWSPNTDIITNEDSPVNIGMTASIDPTNRRLTVNVELFYTNPSVARTADSTNRLTVALLQDGILGPQTGGSTYNPSQMVGGEYRHTHMLRDLLTSTFGDTIKIDSGIVISKTYTKTIPEKYNSIDALINNLSVVAFIAKDNQEIFTGAKAENLLPADYYASIEAKVINHTQPSSMCDNSGSIQVSYKNTGTTRITNFNAILGFENGERIAINDLTQSFSGTLNPNDSTTITFSYDNNQIKNGINRFTVKDPSSVSDGNKNLFLKDYVPTALDPIVFLPSDKITTFPFIEDFETAPSLGLPSSMFRTLNFAHSFAWANNAGNAGGFATSRSAALFQYYVLEPDALFGFTFKRMDFSNFGAQGGLFFSYAKANYGNEADKLDIEASTDCGASWTNLWSKTGAELNTNPASNTNQYLSGVKDDWVFERVSLSDLAGEPDVFIRFKATSGYGQNLFLDDIKIGPNLLSTNNLFVEEKALSVYPNPAKDNFTLTLSQNEHNKTSNEPINLSIIDLTGRVVYHTTTSAKALKNNLSISTNHFAAGVYVIKLNAGSNNHVTKLVVE